MSKKDRILVFDKTGRRIVPGDVIGQGGMSTNLSLIELIVSISPAPSTGQVIVVTTMTLWSRMHPGDAGHVHSMLTLNPINLRASILNR